MRYFQLTMRNIAIISGVSVLCIFCLGLGGVERSHFPKEVLIKAIRRQIRDSPHAYVGAVIEAIDRVECDSLQALYPCSVRVRVVELLTGSPPPAPREFRLATSDSDSSLYSGKCLVFAVPILERRDVMGATYAVAEPDENDVTYLREVIRQAERE